MMKNGKRVSHFNLVFHPPTSTSNLNLQPQPLDPRIPVPRRSACSGGSGDIIQLGDGSTEQHTLEQVPHDFVLDRLYVHNDPTDGQKRGIALNARATTIWCVVEDVDFAHNVVRNTSVLNDNIGPGRPEGRRRRCRAAHRDGGRSFEGRASLKRRAERALTLTAGRCARLPCRPRRVQRCCLRARPGCAVR